MGANRSEGIPQLTSTIGVKAEHARTPNMRPSEAQIDFNQLTGEIPKDYVPRWTSSLGGPSAYVESSDSK
jgi:hypothetical protein